MRRMAGKKVAGSSKERMRDLDEGLSMVDRAMRFYASPGNEAGREVMKQMNALRKLGIQIRKAVNRADYQLKHPESERRAGEMDIEKIAERMRRHW